MDPFLLGGLILGGLNLISGLFSAGEASRQASAQKEAMRRQEGAANQYGVELEKFRAQLLEGLREWFPDNPEWLQTLQNPEFLQALQNPEWLQNFDPGKWLQALQNPEFLSALNNQQITDWITRGQEGLSGATNQAIAALQNLPTEQAKSVAKGLAEMMPQGSNEGAALAREAAAMARRTAHGALMPYFSKLQGRALQGIRAVAGASGLTGSGLEAAAVSQAIGDINAGIAQRLMEYDTARMQALNQAAATLGDIEGRRQLANMQAIANAYNTAYVTMASSLTNLYSDLGRGLVGLSSDAARLLSSFDLSKAGLQSDIARTLAQLGLQADTAKLGVQADLARALAGLQSALAQSAAQLANQYYLTRGNSLMDAYQLIANTLASQYGMLTNVYGQQAGLRGDNTKTYAAMGPDMSWLPMLLMFRGV